MVFGEWRRNLYQPCKHFALISKTVLRWIQSMKTIKRSKKRSKRAKFCRKPHYPDMEESLYSEYKELRYVQVLCIAIDPGTYVASWLAIAS